MVQRTEYILKKNIKTVFKPSSKIKLFPCEQSLLETECLFGEKVIILDLKDEWAKCKTILDNYEGWIKVRDICSFPDPTHRVITPRTFVYSAKDVKSNISQYLPLASKLKVLYSCDKWSEIVTYDETNFSKGYVPTRDIVPINDITDDFVSVAESLIGTPYHWGGRDSIGIDCSALIQIALETIGINFPRNTSLQAKYSLGFNMDYKLLNRGVLIFWQGHVGVMTNKKDILHSNGFFMKTIVEDLKTAEDRIEKSYGKIVKLINTFQII